MNRILLAHELRQGHKSLAIWTSSIAFFIVICIMMFPQISSQMEGVNDIFASMGAFSEAFGMDRLNFGTLIGSTPLNAEIYSDSEEQCSPQ